MNASLEDSRDARHERMNHLMRIPRTADARRLLHQPELDPSFMHVLQEALPDEEARLAYLNHLGWQARS
ncbi:MAG: hypothetical protein KDI50_07145 [Candidatus Competibacteraceae bacterium]|nr:hypothetical protein [Candidatus Competibacteraceae bacterium]